MCEEQKAKTLPSHQSEARAERILQEKLNEQQKGDSDMNCRDANLNATHADLARYVYQTQLHITRPRTVHEDFFAHRLTIQDLQNILLQREETMEGRRTHVMCEHILGCKEDHFSVNKFSYKVYQNSCKYKFVC